MSTLSKLAVSKSTKMVVAASLVAVVSTLGSVAPAAAWDHHGGGWHGGWHHHHGYGGGVFFGGPVYAPYYGPTRHCVRSVLVEDYYGLHRVCRRWAYW